MIGNKLALAIAVGAFTTVLAGGVAVAGFQPFASSGESTLDGPTEVGLERDQPKDQLKAILDGLVAKGTITQAQADSILKAVKDAEPTPRPKPVRPTGPSPMSFIGDLLRATTGYLGMDAKALLTELRNGKSIADVANAQSAQGKSAAGLIDTLTKAANARVDQAIGANKLTAEQAAALKPKIAAEITSYVNRKLTKPRS